MGSVLRNNPGLQLLLYLVLPVAALTGAAMWFGNYVTQHEIRKNQETLRTREAYERRVETRGRGVTEDDWDIFARQLQRAEKERSMLGPRQPTLRQLIKQETQDWRRSERQAEKRLLSNAVPSMSIDDYIRATSSPSGETTESDIPPYIRN